MKYIFIEGLPGIGKTTIINSIREKKLNNIYTVEEIVNKDILENNNWTDDNIIKNEIEKLSKYSDGLIIFDRGPISSLSYAQTNQIINLDYDGTKSIKFFDEVKDLYKNSEIYFLTNNGTNYSITVNEKNSPYGSIDNQRLLEKITIYNCKKYCNNVHIIEYYQKNMEDIIDEIIN